jgi:hypothetical protein
MYEAEEEAWRELARKQDLKKMDEAFHQYLLDCKPEASPMALKEAFSAGWRSAKE